MSGRLCRLRRHRASALTILVLVLVLVLVGCAAVPPTRPTPARVDPAGEPAELVLSTYLAPGYAPGQVVFTIEDATGRRTVPASSFAHVSGGYHRSAVLRTAADGPVTVGFRLSDADGRPLAAGATRLDARTDWRWGLDLHIAVEDPRGSCFGCMGGQRHPIAGRDGLKAEAVHLTWGGQSISRPAVH